MNRRVYSLLIAFAAPFAYAVVLWRGLRDRGYWLGLGERFGGGPPPPSTPTLWLHAVSLGEMSAAAPLARTLREKYPQLPMVLTTATPTGRAQAHALFGNTVTVSYLPYDTPRAVARFLERIRPRIAVIMETELWPNLFHQCECRGVPVLLASARLSEKSVSRYRQYRALFRPVFSANVTVGAQTATDAARFEAIGAAAERTHVIGNIKFDMDVMPGVMERGRRLRASFGDERPVWIAGSTHAGEEEQILAAHRALLTDRPTALLLLVPRHPARFQAVGDLLARLGMPFVWRSSGRMPDAATQVLLVDSVGELGMLYAAADVAFVGGSLVPIGGHNLLEAAALGVPVLTGPHNANSKDVARLMIDQGAAIQVSDSESLTRTVRNLLADPGERRRIGDMGCNLVAANRGSVARLAQLIEPLLPEQPAAANFPSASR